MVVVKAMLMMLEALLLAASEPAVTSVPIMYGGRVEPS